MALTYTAHHQHVTDARIRQGTQLHPDRLPAPDDDGGARGEALTWTTGTMHQGLLDTLVVQGPLGTCRAMVPANQQL